MKVVVMCLSNQVSNEDLVAGFQAFGETIGFEVQASVFTEEDVAKTSCKPSKVQMLIDRLITICGNPDDARAFKIRLRAALFNPDGEVNVEALKCLSQSLTLKDRKYLSDKHLEWLPTYAINVLTLFNEL